MAGLGEACTHIAAILFHTETVSRMKGSTTCMQQECQWVIPSYQKDIPYVPLHKLDFSSAKSKKGKIDSTIASSSKSTTATAPVKKAVSYQPSPDELQSFYLKISTHVSAIQSQPYYHVSLNTLTSLSQRVLYLHFQSPYYPFISQASLSLTLLIFFQQVQRRMNSFTWQLKWSRQWKKRLVCKAIQNCVEQALTGHQKVSYCPFAIQNYFVSLLQQHARGCTHEHSARDCYKEFREKAHTHFPLLDSGLVLNPEWPFLGASPDGTVHCDCCGSGVVEIKCPYCHRHDSAIENQPCLVDNGDRLQLDCSHAYYYQVQTQIFVSNIDYCDFCVCTFPSGGEPSLHVERTLPDSEFWSRCLDASSRLFKHCLLPEILGTWFTKKTTTDSTNPQTTKERELSSCSCTVIAKSLRMTV